MRIQHNIMAMAAYRNYTNNVSAMQKNLEKLSSGYKINRAGDDAAGLAISEKMRAQITGLETAQKNAKDGISLVQTAEGALTEVHDMLNRMVELATQSANGTYDNDTDRYQLQKEMNELRDEIDRIAESSNFNGIQLLDGSMTDVQPATTQEVTTYSIDATSLADALTAGDIFTVSTSPSAPDVGVSSITYNNDEAQKTKMQVDLSDVKWTAAAQNDTLTIKVGSYALTITAAGAGEQDIGALVSAAVGTGITNAQVAGTSTDATGDFKVTYADGVLTFETNGEASDISSDMVTAGALNPNWNVELTESAGTVTVESNWNGGTEALQAGANGKGEQLASTGIATANLGLSATAASNDGWAISVEGKNYVVAVGDDSEWNKYDGSDAIVVKVSDSAGVAEVTRAVVNAINANNGDGVWTAGMNTAGDMTFSQKVGTAGKTADYDLTNAAGIGATFKLGSLTLESDTQTVDVAAGPGKGKLKLQIGDTAATYNQLEVSIDDCHTYAIGDGTTSIADISIATQEDAQAALDVIKAAVNYISNVRGTLGATQNRLEHTINNLSVMTENIQDAESTIRDTDVAEEMMAYTKNNILIQSAQAMLAQANQVPQGVLQLLQ